MKKVAYIVSGIDKALAFEWICEQLDSTKFTLHFILLHSKKGALEQFLEEKRIPFIRLPYSGKADFFRALYKTYLYLKQYQINTVHAHLLDAGLVGITASWLARVKNRIYTRHYSSYHHVYHKKGRWYDRIINALSTRLVAISEVVRQLLVEWEKTNPEKVSVIPHGFPIKAFASPNLHKVAALKANYNIEGLHPIIGVVSRYTHWKGIQYIIPAFEQILTNYPSAVLVLANAKGEYGSTIKKMLSHLSPMSFREIDFEPDLISLFHSFDFFVHVPIDWHSEAFGQVYIEAMATGIPSIFTSSGIAYEIAEHGENCLVVDYQNTESIYHALLKLIQDPLLSERIAQGAQHSVNTRFALSTMIHSLESLYE